MNVLKIDHIGIAVKNLAESSRQIGRASCRERVCYVV